MSCGRPSLALLLLLISTVAGGGEKILTAATLEDYSPYCFPKENSVKTARETIAPKSDSSRLQGYSWDVLRASLHEMGYTIELIIAPWSRAMSMARAGKVDILFPTGLNKERTEFFYYSREPINRADFLVYVRTDSTIDWSGLDSLNGLRIGAMRGWNYGDKWSENDSIEKIPVDTILQGFRMLDKGRIDGFAGYEVNFDHALKRAPSNSTYKKLPPFDFSVEYVAGAKHNPAIISILDDFDAGKRRIAEKGILDEIESKWRN